MAWSRFGRKKSDIPSGLGVKCDKCAAPLLRKELEKQLFVCPRCGHHLKVSGRQRIQMLADPGSFGVRFNDIGTIDRLKFVDKEPYPAKIEAARQKTKETEAAIAGVGAIEGRPIVLCILDFSFLGGSMGTVVGERVTRSIELSADLRLPLVIVSASGGARMHEGALSLMQMAKTSAALARHHEEGNLFISILTNPTTGGVMASFAALGDFVLAEPEALIGFAGPRVIQETLRTELPDGFQRAEFLLEHGFIDRIVQRKDLRAELRKIIDFCWTYTLEQVAPYHPVTAPSVPEDPATAPVPPAPAGPEASPIPPPDSESKSA